MKFEFVLDKEYEIDLEAISDEFRIKRSKSKSYFILKSNYEAIERSTPVGMHLLSAFSNLNI